MRILFVHQNFPAQFKHLAPALAARGDEVTAFGFNDTGPQPGLTVHLSRGQYSTSAHHPWVRDLDSKLIRAEATLRTAERALAEGYVPDLIIAHPGWGESIFLKDVWPQARIALYCELFYRASGADQDFDPEHRRLATPSAGAAMTRLRNLPQRLHFDFADAGISPTRYQAGTYPAEMRERISVIHEGIDTDAIRPGPAPAVHLDGRQLGEEEEVITFICRHLEPYRGIHVFIRALPELLRRRPRARVIIVGSDGRGYGAPPPEGSTWRQTFLAEVADQLDHARVHFVGEVQYAAYLNLLRRSTLHVYLTYPFVLSWSLLEAMATGCAILASDTEPVREFIADGETGMLVPFFDGGALVDRACAMLDDPALRNRLGAAARAKVVAEADLRTICLPRQLAWIDALLARPPRTGAPPV